MLQVYLNDLLAIAGMAPNNANWRQSYFTHHPLPTERHNQAGL